MADSLPFGRSLDLSSDNIPEYYCEPCNELKDEITPIAGHCIDCGENLCVECFNNHLGPKPSRNHKLVDKSAKPPTQPKQQTKSLNSGEKCSVHGATIQSFCTSHSELCCKVCRTINHTTCDVEEISKMARHIQNSQELQILNKKFKKFQKGFEDNLRKTGHHELTIQKNFTNAVNEMKKLRDEIDKLLNETEKLAEEVQEEDFKKIEIVSSTCNIVIEQISNTTSNLDTLNEKNENERLFIYMKRTESQLQSLQNSLDTLDNDNTVREYTFEPDENLKAMMRDLKVLGHLTFTGQDKTQQVSQTKVLGGGGGGRNYQGYPPRNDYRPEGYQCYSRNKFGGSDRGNSGGFQGRGGAVAPRGGSREAPHMDPAVVAAHPMPTAPQSMVRTPSTQNPEAQFGAPAYGEPSHPDNERTSHTIASVDQSLLSQTNQSSLQTQDYTNSGFAQTNISLQTDNLFSGSVSSTDKNSGNLQHSADSSLISQFEIPPIAMPPGHDQSQEQSANEKKSYQMNPIASEFQSLVYPSQDDEHDKSNSDSNNFQGGSNNYRGDRDQRGGRGGGYHNDRNDRGGSRGNTRGGMSNGFSRGGGGRNSQEGGYERSNSRGGGGGGGSNYQGYPPRNDYRPEGYQGYSNNKFGGSDRGNSGGFQGRGGSGAPRGGSREGSNYNRGGS